MSSPVIVAFHIGDVFNPEQIYCNLKLASYHILNEHLKFPKELPYSEPVCASIRGMSGYINNHPEDLLNFTDFLYKNNTGLGYAINFYAEMGSEKAVELFMRLLNNNKEGIDFKFVGRRIPRLLKENRFSDEKIISCIDQLAKNNELLKNRTLDLFHLSKNN